eukprot:5721766-Pyramimonas_sp.AAC.1
MLQKSTKTPVLEPSYLVPKWARFFVIKADRSCADPKATVADRLNWAKLSTKTHGAGINHCVQLTLPFYVTAWGGPRPILRLDQTLSWYVCDRPPFNFGRPSVVYIQSPMRREYQAVQ